MYLYYQTAIGYANVTAKVNSISGTKQTKQHALCDTSSYSKAYGSLNYIRFHDVCTPIIQGSQVTSDEYGNATFSNFIMPR